MEILAFVKESEIDPLFFDCSFFAVPEDAGRKAYQLLLRTLESTQRVGIAKVAMHQREYTVFIRPYDHGLTLHTMYFANEIREAPGYGKTEDIKLKPQEIKLAEQLVENLSEEFNLKKYHDDFQDRLKELIDSKQEGREVAAAPQPHRAPVIDMMEALKKSLAASGASNKKPMHAGRSTELHRRGTRRAAG